MQHLSVAEMAEKWNISERSVRNYCAHNRVEERLSLERPGIFLKMQKNRSVPIRREKNREYCYSKSKKQD